MNSSRQQLLNLNFTRRALVLRRRRGKKRIGKPVDKLLFPETTSHCDPSAIDKIRVITRKKKRKKKKNVTPEGFEPPTYRSGVGCATVAPWSLFDVGKYQNQQAIHFQPYLI